MVLIKSISEESFAFYTNYGSVKAQEIEASGSAAFVIHWKSLRRQIRVRGLVEKITGSEADDYYNSRSLQSRLGAWASRQSQPLKSRSALLAEAARMGVRFGANPPRPDFWGGYRIRPLEIEFWADGKYRLHDRIRWCRSGLCEPWRISRLSP